jgi:multidrug efflux pump subunit AcrA (membrane-fusion protein)
MAVELDVRNRDLRLGAGMYPEVQWPVRRPQPSLLVPPTSIVTTTERTFVVRVGNGVAEWVNVSRGARVGDLVEVFGDLRAGDQIAIRGTDELRAGTRVTPKSATKP